MGKGETGRLRWCTRQGTGEAQTRVVAEQMNRMKSFGSHFRGRNFRLHYRLDVGLGADRRRRAAPRLPASAGGWVVAGS